VVLWSSVKAGEVVGSEGEESAYSGVDVVDVGQRGR